MMKITVLTHVEREASQSPDPVVPQVAKALKQGGHSVSILSVYADVRKLIAGLSRRKPDLIFNLMEMFGNKMSGDIGVAGLLDLLGVPYTGDGPGEFYLGQDKSLTKKLFAFEGIKYPDFAVFSKDQEMETGGNLHMPLFVKPLRGDASIGIDSNSLVRGLKALVKKVTYIHDELNDAALAEEYIEGREFYVGVLGNEKPQALPPIEAVFHNVGNGKPRVADANAKWDKNSPEYKNTESVLADLPDQMRARLQQASLDAYRALRVRDYGRVDLRLAETGEIYVIEVNASCYLEKSSEFATAAAAAGIDYPALINRIVELAAARSKQRRP